MRRKFISKYTPKTNKSNFPKTNREINASSVRLVDQNGEMIGVVSIAEALERAQKAGLDLVEIVPNSTPPVCKILDFGKFKYESKKKIQDSKKKQKVTSLKEMKFKLNIGQSDFDVKMRKIKEFLAEGDKVKVSLWFKGREIVHSSIGMQLFDRIIAEVGEVGKIDAPPKMEGKQIIAVISPAQVK